MYGAIMDGLAQLWSLIWQVPIVGAIVVEVLAMLTMALVVAGVALATGGRAPRAT